MKDHPLSFENLTKFSQSDPYSFIPAHCRNLFEELVYQEKRLRFPAIKSDVGSLLGFMLGLTKGKRVFEMGSGYGHSAFWYFVGGGNTLEQVVLTEKRDDLKEVFEKLSWPLNWLRRMEYWQGDAFEKLELEQGEFDLFLVDGVKADYKKFVEAALPKLAKEGLIAIDNSFWRGSFLVPSVRESKSSAAKVYELHRWIEANPSLQAIFVPFADGLTIIKKSL